MSAHLLINVALFCGILASYAVVMNSDYSMEMGESQSLSDAQRAEQREFQKELAAARACRELHGESGISWTVDGELVCTPRKPRNLSKVKS